MNYKQLIQRSFVLILAALFISQLDPENFWFHMGAAGIFVMCIVIFIFRMGQQDKSKINNTNKE